MRTMAPHSREVRMKELPFFVSWWTALVPGGVTAAVTLVVLVVRAALEGRAATLADVVSALAVGLIVGVVGAVVPFLMMRRAPGQVAHMQFHVGPEGSDEPTSIRFQQFDDSARGVLTRAQDEASRLGHTYMGTEHLLLGLLGDRTSVATQALANLGVEVGKARTAVEFIVGRGDVPASGEIGLTPRAKHVIELAMDEARRDGGTDVRSEHLLLGLVREGEGIAAGVIESFGVEPDQVREEVRRVRDAGDGNARQAGEP
jgi:ClpA/ClpB-like protein